MKPLPPTPCDSGAKLLGQLRALRAVAAVARCGSASRAADALHLSQPAVTRAIQAFEADCGVRLFERGGRGMACTPAGQRASRRAQALLAHLALGARHAQAAAGQPAPAHRTPERFAQAVAPGGLFALAALGRGGSEPQAARLLGLTASGVHRALGQLQQLAGVPLLHAWPGGSRLTAAGEALLAQLGLAGAEARALEAELGAWRGEARGRLVVGALPLSVSLNLPGAMAALQRAQPGVELHVLDGTYETLVEQLRRAELDLLLGALRPRPPEGLVEEALFDDELAVVAHQSHALFARTGLALADLLAHPWVLPLPGSPADLALAAAFAAQGLPPPQGPLRAGSPALTRALVLQTGCLALASRGEAALPEAAPLKALPLALPGTARRIGALRRAGSEPSPELRRLLQALRAPQFAVQV